MVCTVTAPKVLNDSRRNIVTHDSREGGEVTEKQAAGIWDDNAVKALPNMQSIDWIENLPDGLSGSTVSRMFEAEFGKDDADAAAMKRLYRIRGTTCFKIRIAARREALSVQN